MAKSGAAYSWKRHRAAEQDAAPISSHVAVQQGAGGQAGEGCQRGPRGTPMLMPLQRMVGDRETWLWVGMAMGMLSPRDYPILPYPRPVNPSFVIVFLEGLAKASTEIFRYLHE